MQNKIRDYAYRTRGKNKAYIGYSSRNYFNYHLTPFSKCYRIGWNQKGRKKKFRTLWPPIPPQFFKARTETSKKKEKRKKRKQLVKFLIQFWSPYFLFCDLKWCQEKITKAFEEELKQNREWNGCKTFEEEGTIAREAVEGVVVVWRKGCNWDKTSWDFEKANVWRALCPFLCVVCLVLFSSSVPFYQRRPKQRWFFFLCTQCMMKICILGRCHCVWLITTN